MFKFLSRDEQFLRERSKTEFMQAKQDGVEIASSIAFVTLAENGMIDEVTATENAALFSSWASGIDYVLGALRKYEDILYRCVQAHKSQNDWTPEKTPALWLKTGNPAEEYPEWSQPVGAYDAYNLDDKVTFGGKKWVSTANTNIWQPGVYGWAESA